MTPGPLIVISGPSGSGKSTLVRRLLAQPPGPLRLSVSVTTRKPRKMERDGVDYHYWDADLNCFFYYSPERACYYPTTYMF